MQAKHNVAHKALFLDRDGIINIDKGYVYKAIDIEFVEGIFDLVKRFMREGFKIVIVTNQSGIARGMFSEDDFYIVMKYIKTKFKEHNAAIDAVYFCPHHPDFDRPCTCRKPNEGMFIQAQKELDIIMNKSVMVGDSLRDIEAARRAGVLVRYLLSSTKDCDDATVVESLKQIKVPKNG